ncbi:MAG: helix-hairpin-helix domain-containing protein [Bacillota bacterium]
MRLTQEKFWAVIVVVALAAFWLGQSGLSLLNGKEEVEIGLVQPGSKQAQSLEFRQEEILVHIGGAVKQPGIYALAESARVIDAILAAGGETETADLDQINLARKISDSEKIIIPQENRSAAAEASNSPSNPSNQGRGKININKANLDQLTSLPGIGPARAAAIIGFRDDNGNFQQVEDLLQVAGIGASILSNIEDMITVN